MKVVIITAVLVPEADAKKDEEIESDIRTELTPEKIPWCEAIEKIKVLSNSQRKT